MDQIAKLAGVQHGIVSFEQLRALGRSRQAMGRLRTQGYLHRVHPRVYAVGHRALSADGVHMAASLSVRGGSPIARYSAGAHLSLTSRRPRHGLVEVAVPTRECGRRSDLTVVRLASLDPNDLIVERGVPCTSVERTLVDLASVLSEHDLARAIREAEFQRRLDRDAVARILAGISRPRGCRMLRRLLDLPADRIPMTILERHFSRLATTADIGRFVLQQKFVIGDPPREITVDCCWPDLGLVVEVDGPHHKLPAFVRDDAERDAGLRQLGLTVVRVPDDDVYERPNAVIRTLWASSGRLGPGVRA